MATKKEKAAFQREIVKKALELSELIGSAAAGNKMNATQVRHFIQKQEKAQNRVKAAVLAAKEMNAL